jgi:outer membrane protein assembly factor BamB
MPTEAPVPAPKQRFLALSLLAVSALFSGVLIGVLAVSWFTKFPGTYPESSALADLKALNDKDPNNEAIKEALRKEDLRVREKQLTFQGRLRIGSFLLFAGLVVFVVAAHWYASLEPETYKPKARPGGGAASRRRSAAAVAVTAVLIAGGLVAMNLLGGATVPPPPAVAPPSQKPEEPSPKKSEEPVPPAVTFKDSWPGFRGSTGMGIAPPGDYPQKWNAKTGENILWKTPIPLAGKGSPVFADDRIFLTGADEKRQVVYCIHRATGKLLWQTPVQTPEGTKMLIAGEVTVTDQTTYAAPTPVTDGKHVYVVFASADAACLEYDGKVVWAKNLGKPENTYGLASSLLFYKNTLIYQFDLGGTEMDNKSAILGLDPASGAVIWRTERPVSSSWSTPIIVETGKRAELITTANPWVIAYDPEMGTELWRVKGMSGEVAPSPVYADGLAYATNQGAQLMAIKVGGSDDVTATNVAWTANDSLSDASSPVTDGKLILQANSAGTLTCNDAKTGKLVWEKRIDDTFWASPVLAGKTVYLCSDDGKTYIFDLIDKYELISQGELGDSINASPAFGDNRIYIRTEKALFCIGKTK